MKVGKKAIAKDGSGFVQLYPNDDEDLWHLYNLIQEGNEVRASAVRRIVSESSTGSTASQRVRLTLTIQVRKIVYSPAANTSSANTAPGGQSTPGTPTSAVGSSSALPTNGGAGDDSNPNALGTAVLHLSGPITSENQHVKLGAYHTLDVEIGRPVTIIKNAFDTITNLPSSLSSGTDLAGGWDSVALDRIRDASEEARGADVGAIVCGEGVANVCLITQHTTVIRRHIEVSIPRKRKGGGAAQGAEKARQKFHQQIYQAVLQYFDLDKLKAIIVASPGFTKESVLDFIMEEATRTGYKPILVGKPKFVLMHSSSHHVHALSQVLSSNKQLSSQLKDTKFAKESIILDKFSKMLMSDELKAWYGEDHVAKAVERGAVGSLLISDDLFRSSDFVRRKKFVNIVEQVKSFGGEVLMFTSLHESGQRLNDLTGIAAILTFPLDIEVVQEEEKEVTAKTATST